MEKEEEKKRTLSKKIQVDAEFNSVSLCSWFITSTAEGETFSDFCQDLFTTGR